MDAYNFLYLPAALEFRNREERVMFPPLVDAYAPTTTELEDVTGGQRHGPLQGGIRWDDEQGQLAFATMESEVGILLHTISSGATEVGADAGSRDNSPVPRAGQTFPNVIAKTRDIDRHNDCRFIDFYLRNSLPHPPFYKGDTRDDFNKPHHRDIGNGESTLKPRRLHCFAPDPRDPNPITCQCL